MSPRQRLKRGSPSLGEGGTVDPPPVSQAHAASAGLLGLPPELLEDILVLLAESGSPTTIAVLARTCQALRRLIYSPQDKFLWRRIFLTTFDDPRSIQPDCNFNWASEYQARVKASLCMEHHHGSLETVNVERRNSLRSTTKAATAASIASAGFRTRRRSSHSTVFETATGCNNYTITLQTLLSILDSSLPITEPLREAQKQPWENPNLIALTLREASFRAPPFPPHLQTTLPEVSDAVSIAATDGKSDADSAELPPIVRPSKNLAYLKQLLGAGIVPDVVSYLSTSTTSERGAPWQATPEARALNRLVATLGVSVLLEPPRRDASRGRPRDEADTLHRSAVCAPSPENAACTALAERIRHAAQKKVYDMAYLSRRRAWGPFLKVRAGGDPDAMSVDSEDEDEDDGEYRHVPNDTPSDSEAEGSSSESEDGDYAPPQAARPRTPKPLPDASELHADWEHLAAIRVVVQAKLEEKLKRLQTDLGDWFDPGQVEEILKTLFGWENVRACVWSGTPAKRKDDESSKAKAESNTGDVPKSGESSQTPLLKTPSEPVAEWDWAGVEGVWRRCVCWLDYHDLILNNHGGFDTRGLDEATITVPLALRVTGFSPSSVPGYKDFPTIHFDNRRFPTIHVEGTMGGADWMSNGGEEADVRRVRGTVRVCADGSVWWSMLSSIQGSPNDWEWSSEGVQIGAALGPGGPIGVRSGCGILGMWTGWEHEVEDPIGAWWQWKVA